MKGNQIDPDHELKIQRFLDDMAKAGMLPVPANFEPTDYELTDEDWDALEHSVYGSSEF